MHEIVRGYCGLHSASLGPRFYLNHLTGDHGFMDQIAPPQQSAPPQADYGKGSGQMRSIAVDSGKALVESIF